MGRGLPPQLTPGFLRPSSPSRPHSEVFSPTFSSAHQGCSLAEKRTWPPASFLYLSRSSAPAKSPQGSQHQSASIIRRKCNVTCSSCPSRSGFSRLLEVWRMVPYAPACPGPQGRLEGRRSQRVGSSRCPAPGRG